VHADENGVVVFPPELADYVISEAQKVTEREAAQFNWVLSDEFSLEELIKRGEVFANPPKSYPLKRGPARS
ncbi:MAG TPA: hypothetical protein DDY93_13775, partial [Dehalococcoidia bacterium]|nr:hypothetical protein [Dehalococcoidia bacterium]